ncbi:Xaa-Pro peptidase family protein [Acidobacterium sp. S8]|uniref:M24 family metallopeptidase n=1 Tax=Acidobacterium sp. S8 TaxID=1641854 RepID=UPI00131EA799|nr:M24 family metallopeptidase [Acidobacterium sp. S8]
MSSHTEQTVSDNDREIAEFTALGTESRIAEIDEKWPRIAELLDRRQLSGILLRRHENIAWATAGAVEARVAIPSETAVTSLLLLRDGRKYYLAPNNEAARLADEEFAGLGYEPVIASWYENDLNAVRRIVSDGAIGTDSTAEGLISINLAPLRTPLTAGEIARLHWLAQHTADATITALTELKPGMTEFEMSAAVAAPLIAQGILPTVLLMAADNRIYKYKHAVSRGAVLDRYGMLNLCARKWGLAVSITRFVHFGPPPQQLVDAFAACAVVNARLLHASRAGATASELFTVAKEAYRDTGFAGEEELHHQGGPIGYIEREWVATPAGNQTLTASEALAWNPSIRGAKVEDTALLQNGSIDVLTKTPSLPEMQIAIEGVIYPAANVLIR